MKRIRGARWWMLLLATMVLLVPNGVRAVLPEAAANGGVAFSYSGQFIVSSAPGKSPLLELPAVTTNTAILRLEPALLSISAERLKQTLYHALGIPTERNWQGKIFLALHPALWTDENVNVVSRPIDSSWSYLVQLPSVVTADRYLRGMTGVLLLEYANRQMSADGHCAEIPDWLIDGLAGQMKHEALADIMITAPDRPFDHPAPLRTITSEQDMDSFVRVRHVLRRHQVLTFAELCWPTQDQLAGADDGVYQASAQLFVGELLKLNDGPAELRATLASLPQYYNWQTAFEKSFQNHFARSIDVEKWWALTVVEFLSRESGPAWTPGYSANFLNQLLTVQVEMRTSSNSLPSHTEITLQEVVGKFSLDRQAVIFQAHLRDLRIAQFRMAPRFIALTDGYCQALAAYLGERQLVSHATSKRVSAPQSTPVSPRELLKQLDGLDARRRLIEATLAGSPSALQP